VCFKIAAVRGACYCEPRCLTLAARGRQKGYEIMRADMRSLEQRGLLLPADKVGCVLLHGRLSCAPLSLRCDAPQAPRLLCY